MNYTNLYNAKISYPTTLRCEVCQGRKINEAVREAHSRAQDCAIHFPRTACIRGQHLHNAGKPHRTWRDQYQRERGVPDR